MPWSRSRVDSRASYQPFPADPCEAILRQHVLPGGTVRHENVDGSDGHAFLAVPMQGRRKLGDADAIEGSCGVQFKSPQHPLA